MVIISKKIFAMFNQCNRFFHCVRLIWSWNFRNSWWTQKGSYNAPPDCSQEPNNRFFVHKDRNPNVKKGKTENRSGYQNQKTGYFECKNRKTDLKSDQNRKTEKPNVPLYLLSSVLSLLLGWLKEALWLVNLVLKEFSVRPT